MLCAPSKLACANCSILLAVLHGCRLAFQPRPTSDSAPNLQSDVRSSTHLLSCHSACFNLSLPNLASTACREIRDLKDSLTSERDRMARMQQYDQERFRHLNVELQVWGRGRGGTMDCACA